VLLAPVRNPAATCRTRAGGSRPPRDSCATNSGRRRPWALKHSRDVCSSRLAGLAASLTYTCGN